MEVRDVRVGRRSTLNLASVNGAFRDDLRPNVEVSLEPSSEHDALLIIEGTVEPVAASGAGQKAELRRLMREGLPHVARTVGSRSSGQVAIVEVVTFADRVSSPEVVAVGVDDQRLDDARRKMASGRRGVPSETVLGWLQEQVTLAGGGDDTEAASHRERRLVVSGIGRDADIAAGGFRVHGADIDLDIVSHEDSLHVRRIAPATPNGAAERPTMLLECPFSLVDASHATAFRTGQMGTLDRLLDEGDSYLALWHSYNDLEEKRLLDAARAVGVSKYSSRRLRSGAWVFVLDGAQGEAFLHAVVATPEVVLEAGSSPFGGSFSSLGEFAAASEFSGVVQGADLSRGTVSVDLDVRPDVEPPPKGWLRIDLRRDRTRLRRREKARDRILSGQAGLPQLGFLLEGRDPGHAWRRELEALTPAARARFSGAPTQMQKEALRVALNTPDIAIIQGPPGTGKTQVISALQVRLAEEDEREGRPGRSTLLSSFQHDAVEHAMSRTEVMGLPAKKVGERSRGSSGSLGSQLPTFEQWRLSVVEAVRADLADVGPLATAQKRLEALVREYLLSGGTSADPYALLQAVHDICAPHATPGVLAKLDAGLRLASEAGNKHVVVDSSRARAVAALDEIPHRGVPFLPDGPDVAMRARVFVRRVDGLQEMATPTLDAAAQWVADEEPDEHLRADLANEVAEIRGQLDGEVAEASDGVLDPNLVDLLDEVRDAMGEQLAGSVEGADLAVTRYLEDMEYDHAGVDRVAAEYAAVLAATCQQAASREMLDLLDGEIGFDTVIVDEAARANPLDLMIPLSLARRRIVLVGDHRQLPHVLEPDVEAALASDLRDDAEAALRQSLFERLFRQLRGDTDVRRVVSLDTQFRMHPQLARFVSREFYGSAEALQSPRPSSDFQHGLEGYRDRVAVWAELPRSRGEERAGRSKSRDCEAEWIADEIKRLSRERPDLTIGVITFYVAQRERIWNALLDADLAERDGSGRITPIRRLTRGESGGGAVIEPLRVGTVDAFQGMEFDIVVLSMTRSNDLPAHTERERRRKFGFLMLQNRLCVAMSRQRRLLVVVGDSEMVRTEEGAIAVPGLAAFRRLCETEVGHVIRP